MNNFENVEKKEIETDIMRYKNNSLSFLLCIIAIVCNVAMFLSLYSNTACVPNFQLGIDLLVNVIFLLSCFLAAEKLKTYNVSWSYVAFVIAGIEILRIFWIPTMYLKSGLEDPLKGLNAGQFTFIVIMMVIAAVSLVGAGIITLIKAKRLNAHLKRIEEGK